MDLYKEFSNDLSIMFNDIPNPEFDDRPEQIYQLIDDSIEESLKPIYFDMIRAILSGHGDINDDIIQPFIRTMVHIIINADDAFSLNARSAAIYLISKYMKISDNIIHAIRDLDITDCFLEVFGDTEKRVCDEQFIIYFLQFFHRICLHCTDCHHYFVSRLIQHSDSVERIKKYLESIDPFDEKIKRKCLYLSVCLFKNEICPKPKDLEFDSENPQPVPDAEQALLFASLVNYFATSFISITTYPESETTWLFYSFLGLYYIIENTNKEIWRPLLQNLFDQHVETWLNLAVGVSNVSGFTDPHILCVILLLIDIWFQNGEGFDNFNYSLVVGLLQFENPEFKSDENEMIRLKAAIAIDTLAQRKVTVEALVQCRILEITLDVFEHASFDLKQRMASYSSSIACLTTKEIKVQMVEMGYLNIFVEVLDVNTVDFTSLIMDGITALFGCFQGQPTNPCIDIFQDIGGFEFIAQIPADDDMPEKLVAQTNYLLNAYYDLDLE